MLRRAVLGAFAPCFVSLWLAGLGPTLAQPTEITHYTDLLSEAEAQLDALEQDLESLQPQGAGLLAETLNASVWIRDSLNQCVKSREQALERLARDLDSLGPESVSEPAEVTSLRADLQEKLRSEAQVMAACRLLGARRQALVERVEAQRQQILTEHLLARGPDMISVVLVNLRNPAQWWESSRDFVLRDSGLTTLSGTGSAVIGLLAAVGIGLGLVLRRVLERSAQRLDAGASLGAGFARALLACGGRYAPHLLTSALVAAALSIEPAPSGPLPFINVLVYGLGLYFVLVAAIRVFLRPCAPAAAWMPVPEPITRPLGQRLQVLAATLLFGFLIFTTLVSRSLPEPVLLLVRGVYASFLALNLIWVVWLAGRLPGIRNPRRISVALTLVLFAALGAEWLGYGNLSVFATRGLMLSLLILGLTTLIGRGLRELFDSLDEGRGSWQRRLRAALGLVEGRLVPGLIWLRFFAAVGLWGGAAILFLRVWGLSDAGFQRLGSFFADGFAVGNINVVPGRVVYAVLLLVLLLAAAGWVKKQSAEVWMLRTRMDRGAREASVTMIGYAGFALAVLVALSVAGVEFTNLAIIAGALSVGIGFGLQNIVNNFVSGLILLFERPIRTGDWIVVGDTEGYVRRISIRSTQIETFDRADVIVPNSELISGQVTNWMLSDPWGRLRLAVGVAYGSDTDKVRELLLQVARAHEQVLSGHPVVPDPIVLFMAFGDSSLNFELRCYIRQIDRRLSVTSDLNFAVDRAFREAGISIPFPQRDLHLIDWPQPPGALGERPPAGPASGG